MANALAKFFREAAVSLKYRNMRLYCAGAVVSLLGSMMQETMIAWVVYEMTGSTAVLGNIMSWFMLPMIAASIAGGWVADRFNRKYVVLCTQGIALLIALGYMFMTMSGMLNVTAVYALSALLGVTVAFEMSSRMAMLPQLVDDPNHIGNAFAIDSLMFFTWRLCGAALGALFLALTGAAGGFAANAVSYVFELFMLSKLQPKPALSEENKATLKDAFVFAYGNARRRQVLVFLGVITFFGVYIQLMPAFTGLRNGGVWMNGFLIFASEIGAVVASVIIARKTADAGFVRFLRTAIGWCGVVFAVCLAAFAMTTSVVPSLLIMIPTGFAMSAVFTGSQAVLQTEITDERVRGAFTAMFYNFSYYGMLALGGLLLGHIAAGFGLPATMIGAAICVLAWSAYYLISDRKAQSSTPDKTVPDHTAPDEIAPVETEEESMNSSAHNAAVIIPTDQGGIVVMGLASEGRNGKLTLVNGRVEVGISPEDTVVEAAIVQTGLSIQIERLLWPVTVGEARYHFYLARPVSDTPPGGLPGSAVPFVFDLAELPLNRVIPEVYRLAIRHWIDGDDFPPGLPPPPIPGGPPGNPPDPDDPGNNDDPGNPDDPGDNDAPSDPTSPP